MENELKSNAICKYDKWYDKPMVAKPFFYKQFYLFIV